MLFGAWTIIGLFVDGWAHNHQKPESVFTPWHALLYSGYLASLAYALLLVRRHHRPGRRLVDSVPVGQALVLVGLAVFAVGAAGDMVWHSVFGIERDLAALLSPTHLLMFSGGVFLLTGPLRAAWLDLEEAPSFRRFLPALASLALATALVAFFFMYLTPFRLGSYGGWVKAYTAVSTRDPGSAGFFAAEIQIVGVAAVLVTNLIYLTPLLLLLRRWHPPFGTATILFSSVTVLVGAIDTFSRWPILLAAPVAGLVADVLIARLRPSPARPWPVRLVATVVPLVLWLAFFALYHLFLRGVGWEAELWFGVTVMAALAGAGLSLLVVPPGQPAPARPAPARATA